MYLNKFKYMLIVVKLRKKSHGNYNYHCNWYICLLLYRARFHCNRYMCLLLYRARFLPDLCWHQFRKQAIVSHYMLLPWWKNWSQNTRQILDFSMFWLDDALNKFQKTYFKKLQSLYQRIKVVFCWSDL